MLSLAFLAIAGIGGWPNGGQAKAIGAILASRQALGPNIFEAFICCRLLFWRLRALAGGLTGARQKQLVQFWLPGRLWAPISSWICKNIAARISL